MVSNLDIGDIFERLKAGGPVRLDDPAYCKIQEVVDRTIALSAQLNTSTARVAWLLWDLRKESIINSPN